MTTDYLEAKSGFLVILSIAGFGFALYARPMWAEAVLMFVTWVLGLNAGACIQAVRDSEKLREVMGRVRERMKDSSSS